MAAQQLTMIAEWPARASCAVDGATSSIFLSTSEHSLEKQSAKPTGSYQLIHACRVGKQATPCSLSAHLKSQGDISEAQDAEL